MRIGELAQRVGAPTDTVRYVQLTGGGPIIDALT